MESGHLIGEEKEYKTTQRSEVRGQLNAPEDKPEVRCQRSA
jgi:hypothetical protein